MGADGGMSNSVSRGFAMPLSDLPPLPQYIPLDPISLGSQKYTRSGELRRALGFPLGGSSVENPFRASGYKPCPPVATEELKQFKENVLDASMKARYAGCILLHEEAFLWNVLVVAGINCILITDTE